MVDDDEQVEVGLVSLGGVRLVDPAAARIASVEDDLEDARLLLPAGRGNCRLIAEFLEEDLDDALQLALLGGRQMVDNGAHRYHPSRALECCPEIGRASCRDRGWQYV